MKRRSLSFSILLLLSGALLASGCSKFNPVVELLSVSRPGGSSTLVGSPLMNSDAIAPATATSLINGYSVRVSARAEGAVMTSTGLGYRLRMGSVGYQ